jgi:hypothetical protein
MSTKYKTKITVAPETRGFGESKRVIPGADVTLEATIDWTRLFNHFGAKAYRSKGKRTVALAGIIRIKATKVVELAP